MAALAALALGCGSSGTTNPGDGGGGSSPDGGGGGSGPDASSAAPCGIPEMEPNDSRDNAVPYSPGTDVTACLGADKDVDFYEMTAPAGDMAGGYYQASITNVGDGNVDAKVYSASDNSLVLQFNYTVDSGASLYFYWAAAPGQKYRVSVTPFAAWQKPFKYTFKASYQKVNDAFEPNDSREMAKPLTLGTPVMPFFFTGFKSGMIAPAEYQDWFSFTLAAGMVTIKVENVPTNVRPQIKLLDPSGAEVNLPMAYNNTEGGSLNVSAMVTAAGMYRLVVDIFSVLPDAAAPKMMMVPDNFTRPYSLTVSQP
jgi:hypothetical protein